MGQAAVRNQLAVLDTARNALEATDAVRQIANQIINDQQAAAATQAKLETEVAELRQIANGLIRSRDAATIAIAAAASMAESAGKAAHATDFKWTLLSGRGVLERLRFVLTGELPR